MKFCSLFLIVAIAVTCFANEIAAAKKHKKIRNHHSNAQQQVATASTKTAAPSTDFQQFQPPSLLTFAFRFLQLAAQVRQRSDGYDPIVRIPLPGPMATCMNKCFKKKSIFAETVLMDIMQQAFTFYSRWVLQNRRELNTDPNCPVQDLIFNVIPKKFVDLKSCTLPCFASQFFSEPNTVSTNYDA